MPNYALVVRLVFIKKFENIAEISLIKYLPVEERLGALTVEPHIIVEMQIVSIPVSWINLQNTGIRETLFIKI